MTPKSARVSIFKQIVHEFRVSIKRALKEGRELSEIENSLTTLSADGIKELTKYALALILLAVVSSTLSAEGEVKIQTSFIQVSLPLVYVSFAAAYLVFAILIGSMLQLQYSTAQTVARFVAYDWRRFALMDLAMRGNNQIDILSPIRNDHLFRIRPLPHLIVSFIFLLPILAVMLPAIGAYGLFLSISLSETFAPSDVYLARPIAISSLMLQVMPLAYLLFLFVPFRIRKDKQAIRWRFLIFVYRRYGVKSPQLKEWVRTDI